MATTGKTQRRAQTLIGGVILLLVATFMLTLWLNRAPEELLPAVIDKLPENVDIGLDRVHYSQSENGRRSWELDADRAAYQRKEEELSLTGVKLTFFEAGRFGDLSLTADKGTLYQQKKLVRVEGNIHLVAASGETFETDALDYHSEERLIESEQALRFQGPQLRLTGEGFRLDLNSGTLKVHRDVRAVFTEPDIKGENR